MRIRVKRVFRLMVVLTGFLVSAPGVLESQVCFEDPTPYPAGGNPDVIVHGDFNEDGRADLAVAKPSEDEVSVFLGNGPGTF